ncbi:MAG: hypothetical protein HY282_18190 [Nitrospirae bacterium]|nr:hypothetical protein [Candidatus Manganitrophaceae bacterium]
MKIKQFGSLFVILIALSTLTACYGKAAVSKIPHFSSPSGWPNEEASAKNNEGVDHLLKSHWDTAAPFFKESIRLSPSFPEPYFNLGVALDGMGKQEEATEAFKSAKSLGTDDPRIMSSEILKAHIKS